MAPSTASVRRLEGGSAVPAPSHVTTVPEPAPRRAGGREKSDVGAAALDATSPKSRGTRNRSLPQESDGRGRSPRPRRPRRQTPTICSVLVSCHACGYRHRRDLVTGRKLIRTATHMPMVEPNLPRENRRRRNECRFSQQPLPKLRAKSRGRAIRKKRRSPGRASSACLRRSRSRRRARQGARRFLPTCA